MKSENLPAFEFGLTFVKRHNDVSGVIRLWTLSRTDERITLKRWELPSGAPSPDQLRDVLASLTDEATATILATSGVQGVLC